MKILVITKNILPTAGIGRYSAAVVEELKKQGNEVYVSLDSLKEKRNIFSFLIKILLIRRMARNVDVVHALDGWPYGIYGYFAVLGTKNKLFINGVGTYSVAPLLQFSKRLLLTRAYNRAKKIFVISRYVGEGIKQLTGCKNVLVVHLANERLPEVSKEEVGNHKKNLGLDENFPIILTVGEIKDRKGQLDTLKAVGLLKAKYPNIFYAVVGSAKNKAYVNSMIDFAAKGNLLDNFRIFENIDADKDLASFYSLADVFALNSTNDGSHFEGFGLVILEANQFGKPAVGSSNCGIEDSINDGVTGFLALPRNPKDISEKLEKCLTAGLKAENIETWYNSFTWEKTVSAYIEAYKQ